MQPPAIRHPDSRQAFQDIHVLKLLVFGRNIKKISYSEHTCSCTRQLREHFVQSIDINLRKHLLIPESS